MIMTKPSHSLAAISFYSKILCETDIDWHPEGLEDVQFWGFSTLGDWWRILRHENNVRENLHLFISEQPWSVMTLSLSALIASQGRRLPPANNCSAAIRCQDIRHRSETC